MFLAYDTETLGLPLDPGSTNKYDVNNWPRIYQLGALLFDDMGLEYGRVDSYIRPEGWTIPVVDPFLADLGVESFHEKQDITTEFLMDVGRPIHKVLPEFIELANMCTERVCHNAAFDNPVVVCEFFRLRHFPQGWDNKPQHCTKLLSEDICRIPGFKGKFKWPSLQEAYKHFFGREFEGAHNAFADVQATADVFLAIRQHLAQIENKMDSDDSWMF